jgi:hypothetical protein
MSAPSCIATLTEVEDLLSTPAGGDEARRLLARGASTQEFLDMFIRHTRPDVAEVARMEFAELPESTIMLIVQAWVMAESAGKPLSLASVPPARPLEAARNLRVELAISMDEGGVRVALSHIPGRHASWYRPAVTV